MRNMRNYRAGTDMHLYNEIYNERKFIMLRKLMIALPVFFAVLFAQENDNSSLKRSLNLRVKSAVLKKAILKPKRPFRSSPN
jgi:hypothetical protein